MNFINFNKRILSQILLDCVIVNISAVISYFFRYGKALPIEQLKIYLGMALLVTITKIVVFYFMGLYKPMWKYAGIDEIMNLLFMSAVANGFIIVGIYMLQYTVVPRSIYLIAALVDFVLLTVSRFSKQIVTRMAFTEVNTIINNVKKVMIIGAGEAGGLLIQEFRNHPGRKIAPICIIDDDITKKGRKINGIPVVGTRNDIINYVAAKKIEQIIIAIPTIKKDDLTEIVSICRRTSSELKILPNINELRDIKTDIQKTLLIKMRNVEIEDLLGREEVVLNNESIEKNIKGKTVLVTGGGGSIGSELCRQLCRFSPNELVIVDFSEENAYNIQMDLRITYPNTNVHVCIASIREKSRIDEIFSFYKPSVVFHAAAHKHVPLMEENPKEAIKNNILGTWNVVLSAMENDVQKFVLISTDKSVNPTNVMGASKKTCELIVQAAAKESKTEFTAVRFGNVLGSSGSVIPLFKKQIAAGGPVTVMHPEIVRYFMTIQEASRLVIQTCAIAKGGEIFVLDMGEAVKIDKLARDLIKLSGFEPDVDIEVKYTGLRPGEKLYEELLTDEEGLTKSEYDKIYVAKPGSITLNEVRQYISDFSEVLDKPNEEVFAMLQQVVPSYVRQQ